MSLPLKIAFQPPSDMGTVPSGGGNKMWKVLGIGCAIFVLIGGIALAFGIYKGVSFCGGGIDIMKSVVNGQKFAGEFATDISKGEFEKAYGKMTPRYQTEVSKDDFVAKFTKYKDSLGASPIARGFNANQINEKKEYKASYFFPLENGGQNPTINFTVLAIEGGEKNNNFQIDAFEIFLSERSMDSEMPAQMVMRFHDQIAKGQDQFAYMTMGEGFRQKTDEATFRQFLKDAGPTFTTGRWEIQNVKYHTGDSATVMVISRTRSSASMVIQFELAKIDQMGIPLWQIVAIAPLVAGDTASDATVEEKPADERGKKIDVPKVDDKDPSKN